MEVLRPMKVTPFLQRKHSSKSIKWYQMLFLPLVCSIGFLIIFITITEQWALTNDDFIRFLIPIDLAHVIRLDLWYLRRMLMNSLHRLSIKAYQMSMGCDWVQTVDHCLYPFNRQHRINNITSITTTSNSSKHIVRIARNLAHIRRTVIHQSLTKVIIRATWWCHRATISTKGKCLFLFRSNTNN